MPESSQRRSLRSDVNAKRTTGNSVVTNGVLSSTNVEAPSDGTVVGSGGGHHAVRQLMNKERKARQALVHNEAQEYSVILCQTAGADAMIAAFRQFHEQNTLVTERHQRTRAQWAHETFLDEVRKLVAAEAAQRVAVTDRHEALWRTVVHLFHTEGKPLFAARARSLLFEAENARREFIYREEITAGLQLPLPGYQPVYVGSLRQGVAAMSAKVDFMAQESCPFRFGEHCPYFPKSVLQRSSAQEQLAAIGRAGRGASQESYHHWLQCRHTDGASKTALITRELAAHQHVAAATTNPVACSSPRAALRTGSPRAHQKSSLPHVKLPAVVLDGHVQMSTYAFLSKAHYHFSDSCLIKGGKRRM